MKLIELYTDGACSGNPGSGGFGVILKYGGHIKEIYEGYRLTTNNRMELLAAIKGLEALKEPCKVDFEALLSVNRLRYRLLPYIYSLAGEVWLKDIIMMKPLVFAFPQDTQVLDCKDQYLFGDRLMVCPVTEPMYYGVNSERLQGGKKSRRVYLPEGERWYKEECIPEFVAPYYREDELEYRVYKGKDWNRTTTTASRRRMKN